MHPLRVSRKPEIGAYTHRRPAWLLGVGRRRQSQPRPAREGAQAAAGQQVSTAPESPEIPRSARGYRCREDQGAAETAAQAETHGNRYQWDIQAPARPTRKRTAIALRDQRSNFTSPKPQTNQARGPKRLGYSPSGSNAKQLSPRRGQSQILSRQLPRCQRQPPATYARRGGPGAPKGLPERKREKLGQREKVQVAVAHGIALPHRGPGTHIAVGKRAGQVARRRSLHRIS